MVTQSAEILKQSVLEVNSSTFDALALDIFRFQAEQNPVYRRYLQYLGIDPSQINSILSIPFLPIEFFKTQQVITGNVPAKVVFESSGTTGLQTSRHFVHDPDFYIKVAIQIFEKFYGSLKDFQILALLPSYLERNNSSLVYMVKHFIEQTGSEHSGFYLNEYQSLLDALQKAHTQNPKAKVLLIGVTFGLLDLAESGLDFSFMKDFEQVVVMETGGMKGRRKEMLREEIHEILTQAFSVNSIHSEYGMTELLSQGYSFGEGIFELPASMKVLLRDVNDPFAWVDSSARSGGVNVIDLANVDSCSFIETKDLGAFLPDNQRFRILGRFDNSDIRGCNLMVL
ncbi:LuxE/PaaK family acyltransferase [Flectobacillus major]|uniref:LuxE/PaaK family acyltransferase n=1 Tax=Flectobacillus major TaxID=103 RepID=UPI000422D945|nr:acyltransferase [Flectobacillus major]